MTMTTENQTTIINQE